MDVSWCVYFLAEYSRKCYHYKFLFRLSTPNFQAAGEWGHKIFWAQTNITANRAHFRASLSHKLREFKHKVLSEFVSEWAADFVRKGVLFPHFPLSQGLSFLGQIWALNSRKEPHKWSYTKLSRYYLLVTYFVSKNDWKLLWKQHKVEIYPWMVI